MSIEKNLPQAGFFIWINQDNHMIINKLKVYAISIGVIFLFQSCSLNRLAVRQLTPVLENSANAIFEETDLIIAEQSLISNIKLLEGLLKTDPENQG